MHTAEPDSRAGHREAILEIGQDTAEQDSIFGQDTAEPDSMLGRTPRSQTQCWAGHRGARLNVGRDTAEPDSMLGRTPWSQTQRKGCGSSMDEYQTVVQPQPLRPLEN